MVAGNDLLNFTHIIVMTKLLLLFYKRLWSPQYLQQILINYFEFQRAAADQYLSHRQILDKPERNKTKYLTCMI